MTHAVNRPSRPSPVTYTHPATGSFALIDYIWPVLENPIPIAVRVVVTDPTCGELRLEESGHWDSLEQATERGIALAEQWYTPV